MPLPAGQKHGNPGSNILRKKTRGSSTPGYLKGLVPSKQAKVFCRRNRSYKNPEYETVMATLGKVKGGKK